MSHGGIVQYTDKFASNPAVSWDIIAFIQPRATFAMIRRMHHLVERLGDELLSDGVGQAVSDISHSNTAPVHSGSANDTFVLEDNSFTRECRIILSLHGPERVGRLDAIAHEILSILHEPEPLLVLSAPGVCEQVSPEAIQLPALTRRNRG